ncbi:UNVERIFIED_CONTAM: hypothetical protein Sindi_1991300 [Sesamum indicum]
MECMRTTHTTTSKTTHSSHGIHVDATADEDEDDMVARIDDGELGNVVDEHGEQANSNNAAATDDRLDGEDAPAINQSPMEFQFADFIVLANRVIEKGDDESVHALNDLHWRWTAKYGESDRNSQELLFRHLVCLKAEQVAEHPLCFSSSLQISENKATADLNLRVSIVLLAARDETAIVAQAITLSPNRIQNIGEPEMMMMITAANTTATAQIASATGRAEIAKTATAAVSTIKVTLSNCLLPMLFLLMLRQCT